MHDELETFRKQREQIRAHLAWLDAEISRREGNSPEVESTENQAPLAVPEVSPTAPGPQPEPPAQVPPISAPVRTEETTAPTDAEDPVFEEVIKRHAPEESTNLAGTKLGCSLIIIGLTLLFLFCMFVLPFWFFD